MTLLSKKSLFFLLGGAGAMYLLDPKHGKRRRKQAQKRVESLQGMTHSAYTELERSIEQLQNPRENLRSFLSGKFSELEQKDLDAKHALSTIGLCYLGARTGAVFGVPGAILGALTANSFLNDTPVEGKKISKALKESKEVVAEGVQELRAL